MNNFIKNISNYIPIILITILAIILRFISINAFGDLDLDELVSWHFANQKDIFETIKSAIKEDVHMPLFYIILHYWIKIFSDSEFSMRLCSASISIFIIPVSYFFINNIFNKKCAIYCSILFAIGTFCIHYSIFVRFYGLCMLLAIISAFYFVKAISEYRKKDIAGFIISQSLLVYTYSLSPLLSLSYFVVALHKSIKDKTFKKVISMFVLHGIIILPALISIYKTTNEIKQNAISVFAVDVEKFEWGQLTKTAEEFFANPYTTNYESAFNNLLYGIADIKYILLVLIPILISLFCIIKVLLLKEKKNYLLIMPYVILTAITVILAYFNLLRTEPRHLAIIYPIAIIGVSIGICSFKRNIVQNILFVLLIFLNSISLVLYDETIYNRNFKSIGNIKPLLKEMKISENDLYIIPFGGNKLEYYTYKGKIIPFAAEDGAMLKDKKSKEFYFGDDYKKLNPDNIKEYLKENIVNNNIQESYEKNLLKYIKQMHQNDKLIVIIYRDKILVEFQDKLAKRLYKNNIVYERSNRRNIILAKIMYDTISICKKYLTEKSIFNDKEREYTIYIFEK